MGGGRKCHDTNDTMPRQLRSKSDLSPSLFVCEWSVFSTRSHWFQSHRCNKRCLGPTRRIFQIDFQVSSSARARVLRCRRRTQITTWFHSTAFRLLRNTAEKRKTNLTGGSNSITRNEINSTRNCELPRNIFSVCVCSRNSSTSCHSFGSAFDEFTAPHHSPDKVIDKSKHCLLHTPHRRRPVTHHF